MKPLLRSVGKVGYDSLEYKKGYHTPTVYSTFLIFTQPAVSQYICFSLVVTGSWLTQYVGSQQSQLTSGFSTALDEFTPPHPLRAGPRTRERR